MIRVLKVSGESLKPLLQEGDFVLVLRIPFRFLHKGDLIAFNHPIYGVMVKLIDDIPNGKTEISVSGIHPFSTDSRSLGAIPKRAIIGKVIWHIPRRG